MLSQEVIRRYLSAKQAVTPMPGERGGGQMEVAKKGRRGKSGTGWRGLSLYHAEDIYMAAVAPQTLRVMGLNVGLLGCPGTGRARGVLLCQPQSYSVASLKVFL